MNISWKWLNELIDLQKTKPKKVARELTLAGFEIENIINKPNKDIIFNINTAANRSDTTSIIGIAREISTILKKPIHRINNQKHYNIKHNIINNQFIHGHNFLYSHFTHIKIKSSPTWLKSKLETYGITSINNLIDIINLIGLKWGQHLEIFDLNKISTNDKILMETQYNTIDHTLITRNNQIVSLNKHPSIIITNNNNPISLAGIDASKSSQIDINTSTIVLQASIFNKHTIKEISKVLQIQTENSIKQIKGICSFDILNAYSEAILLIEYLCKGQIQNIHYFTSPQIQYKPFIISEAYINNILGFTSTTTNIYQSKTIIKTEIIEILKYLNCMVFEHFKYLEIYIPAYRSTSIVRIIDLVEEIGRIYGFDKFIDYIPRYNLKGTKRKEKIKIDQIRNILRTIGLTETVHYSLIKSDNNGPKIFNPLTEDHIHLRNNIINNLINTNLNNLKQGNETIEIFEIGRIFKKSNNNYIENIHLAGLLGSKEYYRSEWSEKPKELTWFQAKGDIDEIFEKLQINITWNKPRMNYDYDLYNQIQHFFHPNRVAILLSEGKLIGIFGQLDLKICKAYNIPKHTYIFELQVQQLLIINYKKNYHLKNYSKYPYIMRDITISSIHRIQVSHLLTYMRNKKNPLIESIVLFNYYKTYKQEQEVINLGFRIKYRSHTDTLTNNKIDIINQELQNMMEEYLEKMYKL